MRVENYLLEVTREKTQKKFLGGLIQIGGRGTTPYLTLPLKLYYYLLAKGVDFQSLKNNNDGKVSEISVVLDERGDVKGVYYDFFPEEDEE